MAALYVLPGLAILPAIGGIADAWGIRTGLLLMAPVFLIGCLVIASGAPLVTEDLQRCGPRPQRSPRCSTNAGRAGRSCCSAAASTVHYDRVQVLFGVDFEIDEGEIVALLGTNGAGKSTLLRAICGTTEVSGGAVVFDGRDMTHTPPNEAADAASRWCRVARASSRPSP